MGAGAYSPSGFLRGWNSGNQFGYRAILSRQPAGPLVLPSARVEAMWRWNFARHAISDEVERRLDELPPCYVPPIHAVRTGETDVKTLVIWDLDMAIAIPEVDLVVTAVDREARALPSSEVFGALAIHTTWPADHEVDDKMPIGMTTRLVDTMSPAATAKLRAAMRPFKPICRLSLDQVLDAELVSR